MKNFTLRLYLCHGFMGNCRSGWRYSRGVFNGKILINVTLANDQLDAQLLHFIIRLLQSSTCFEQRRSHHQEVKL